jgi:hypothetical protein
MRSDSRKEVALRWMPATFLRSWSSGSRNLPTTMLLNTGYSVALFAGVAKSGASLSGNIGAEDSKSGIVQTRGSDAKFFVSGDEKPVGWTNVFDD